LAATPLVSIAAMSETFWAMAAALAAMPEVSGLGDDEVGDDHLPFADLAHASVDDAQERIEAVQPLSQVRVVLLSAGGLRGGRGQEHHRAEGEERGQAAGGGHGGLCA